MIGLKTSTPNAEMGFTMTGLTMIGLTLYSSRGLNTKYT